MAQAVRTAESPPPSLLPALSRIVEMAKLSPNWDGEDADPPTAEAVAAACFLIEAVAEHRLQQGDVVIPPRNFIADPGRGAADRVARTGGQDRRPGQSRWLLRLPGEMGYGFYSQV